MSAGLNRVLRVTILMQIAQVLYQPSRLHGAQVNVDHFAYETEEVRHRTLLDAFGWAEGTIKHMEAEDWHQASFAKGSSTFPYVVPRVRCPLSRFHEDGRCIVQGAAGCVRAGVEEYWAVRRSTVFTITARLIMYCRELQGHCGLMDVHQLKTAVYEIFGMVLRIGALSSRAHIAWDGLGRHLLRRSWRHVDFELKTCLAKVVGTLRSVSGKLGEITERINAAGRRLRVETAAARPVAGPESAVARSEVRQPDCRLEPRRSTTTTAAGTAVRSSRQRRFFFQPRSREVETARATLSQVARPWRPRDL